MASTRKVLRKRKRLQCRGKGLGDVSRSQETSHTSSPLRRKFKGQGSLGQTISVMCLSGNADSLPSTCKRFCLRARTRVFVQSRRHCREPEATLSPLTLGTLSSPQDSAVDSGQLYCRFFVGTVFSVSCDCAEWLALLSGLQSSATAPPPPQHTI